MALFFHYFFFFSSSSFSCPDYSLLLLIRGGELSGTSSYQGLVQSTLGMPGYYFLSFIQYLFSLVSICWWVYHPGGWGGGEGDEGVCGCGTPHIKFPSTNHASVGKNKPQLANKKHKLGINHQIRLLLFMLFLQIYRGGGGIINTYLHPSKIFIMPPSSNIFFSCLPTTKDLRALNH